MPPQITPTAGYIDFENSQHPPVSKKQITKKNEEHKDDSSNKA